MIGLIHIADKETVRRSLPTHLQTHVVGVLLAYFCIVPEVLSQASLRLDRISSDIGLSQNMITAIFQDRRGFLWFGTKDGLNRFDGYKFIVYQHNPFDSTSLSNNIITSIFEDSQGRIWVGTHHGLNLFDRRIEKFYRIFPNPESHDGLSTQYVQIFAEDPRGAIWMGSLGRGLIRLQLPAGATTPERATLAYFQHIPADPNSLSNNFIYGLAVDSRGTVWVATEKGINVLLPKPTNNGYEVHPFRANLLRPAWKRWLTSNNFACALAPGKQNTIWIGIGLGLIHWDGTNESFTYYDIFQERKPPFSWIDVRAMMEDRAGIVWFGAFNGLARFDPRENAFAYYRSNETGNRHGLPESGVISILEDKGGVLWLGSNGNGLFRHDPKAERFNRRHSGSNKITLWRGTSLRGISETSDGALWLGPATSGLYRMDRSTGEITVIPDFPGLPQWGTVYSILQDRSGMLWLGTSTGLFRLQWRNQRIEQRSFFDPDPEGYSSVFRVYEDRAGRIWVTTRRNLCRLDQLPGKIVRYRYLASDHPASLALSEYTFIHEDPTGVIWLGTTEGLMRFDPEAEEFKRYRNDPKDLSSLSYNAVRAIHDDPLEPERYLWVGTAGGGLSRFDRHSETFMHFTAMSGLPHNVIYAILGDSEGNLWMSTNHGLSKFNPRTYRFKNFDAKDGLQDNEFNSGSYFKSASGELFFGGIGGFNAFYPKDIQDNPHAPPLVFTDFYIFNKSASHKSPGSPLTQEISEIEEITLLYEHKVFSFEFAALDFTAPAKNQYAYKMENFDDEWQEVGTQRLATYTNLDPGNYVFHVKGSNNDGIWNEAGASIRIIITPPWYRTWLAYTLYGLILVAGVFAVDRIQRRRLIRQERQRAALREAELRAQTAEAASEAKTEFLSNVSHELRTPLTSVLGFAKIVKKRLEEKIFPLVPVNDDKTQRLIDQVSENLSVVVVEGERLTALIDNVLDLAKIEAGKLEWNMTTISVPEIIARATAATASLFESSELNLVKDLNGDFPEILGDRDKLIQVVINLLSNAVKFMEKGNVICRALQNGNEIVISVSDTGIGIAAEDQPKVFEKFTQVGDTLTDKPKGTGLGLTICKEIVEYHGGRIWLESELGKGSTFSVSLPVSVKKN